MGIFDDVMLNAKTAASAVGKKAEKILDLSKLKYAAAGISNDISKKKEQLGDFVYESSKNGTIDNKVLAEKIAEIQELENNLAATKELIIIARNKKLCKRCGCENEKEAVFCNKCGEKLTDDEATVQEEAEENNTEEADATIASHDVTVNEEAVDESNASEDEVSEEEINEE